MAVQDCGAAAADAAAQEPSDDEKSNKANDQPSPPDWTALTAKASNALVGIAGSDGTEALVSCELVGNSTLSSVDLGKEVVNVILSLADGLVQVVIGVPAVSGATLDSDLNKAIGQAEDDINNPHLKVQLQSKVQVYERLVI